MIKASLPIALLSTICQAHQDPPAWHRFATNANYRLTALLDVNGGASSTSTDQKSGGYTVPIEVLTLYHRDDDTYHQRISYYSGTYVEYNIDGAGYSVVPTPYGHDHGVDGGSVCFYEYGNETEKEPYLNFFPTLEQMEMYTVGQLVTDEAGIPYRVATLEASHNTLEPIPSSSEIPSGYDAGMPANDWFEFRYQESLSTGAITGTNAFSRPLKWTMLARNQIISAHTEHWVIRYTSYEAIDAHNERGLWEDWLHMNFRRDCSDDNAVELGEGSHHNMKMNRLGMFFSSSFGRQQHRRGTNTPPSSPFDTFLARHSKQYSTEEEYFKRKSIHDFNTNSIQKWNVDHYGRTSFAHNEFMDLELHEVMKFRGGHIPIPALARARRAATKKSDFRSSNKLRQLSVDDEIDVDLDNYNYTVYEAPADFDPSTFPREFDWRTHMPGSVSPIKDQGFCGSCWAFSFISALESHWYITNSQSVLLPEQFVNDCLWTKYSHACDGGQSYVAALTTLERFGGMIPAHNTYGSYLSVDGQCYVDILQGLGMLHGQEEGMLSQTMQPSSTVRLLDWVIIPERDDVAIKHALLNQGPLSVGFNVVDESLFYSNGVLDVESCTANTDDDLDHAINLVGWGVDTLEDGTEAEHWILRNSWSTVWGDGGYLRVRMGERDCGVATSAGFPIVEQIARATSVE